MGEKAKGHRLTKMTLDEVSHVRRGANQLATNVIWKSDDYPTTNNTQYRKSADTNPLGGNMPTQAKGNETQAPDLSGLAPEVLSYIQSLQKNTEELTEALEESTATLDEIAAMGDDDAEGEDDEDDEDDENEPEGALVGKSTLSKADAEIQKAFNELQTRLSKAEAQVIAERDVRLNGEYIAKAATLDKLSIDSSKMGPIFKSIAEKLDPEEFEALWSMLSNANEAVKKSGLFKEIGKSVDLGGSTATEIIEKSVETLRAGDTKLTREQAVQKALELRPELYTEYLAERRSSQSH